MLTWHYMDHHTGKECPDHRAYGCCVAAAYGAWKFLGRHASLAKTRRLLAQVVVAALSPLGRKPHSAPRARANNPESSHNGRVNDAAASPLPSAAAAGAAAPLDGGERAAASPQSQAKPPAASPLPPAAAWAAAPQEGGGAAAASPLPMGAGAVAATPPPAATPLAPPQRGDDEGAAAAPLPPAPDVTPLAGAAVATPPRQPLADATAAASPLPPMTAGASALPQEEETEGEENSPLPPPPASPLAHDAPPPAPPSCEHGLWADDDEVDYENAGSCQGSSIPDLSQQLLTLLGGGASFLSSAQLRQCLGLVKMIYKQVTYHEPEDDLKWQTLALSLHRSLDISRMGELTLREIDKYADQLPKQPEVRIPKCKLISAIWL